MKRKILIISITAALAIPAISYGLPWSRDFYGQPSYRAQEKPIKYMPEGTVPSKGKPAHRERGAAAGMKNPFTATPQSIERGKERYDIYCLPCHGDKGKGDGLVGQKFVPPTDLSTEYVQTKPDGDIYATITYGGLAIMPLYGDSVPAEDRWHIVNYIKNVLGGNTQAAKQ